MKPPARLNPITCSIPGLDSWKLAPSPWVCRNSMTDLTGVVARYAPISLADMGEVALLNRVDVKFILSNRQLLNVLDELQDDYWILEVNGHRLNQYRTLYFDTLGFDLYLNHVNNRPERYKVRCREYIDTQVSFLEVKHRTNKDRTIKTRIPTEHPAVLITPAMNKWLRGICPLDGCQLVPKLWNTFARITLVSKLDCERVTLDVDLAFASGGKRVQLDGISVAEVKINQFHRASPFLSQMRRQRIHEQGFSKYAFGIATLVRSVKKNALKPKLLRVAKLMSRV